jgi:hypothetical protein
MNPKFQFYAEQLEPKFQELISMQPVRVTSLPLKMPDAGIYVFYEEGKPLYVGRSNALRRRLKFHSSNHAKDAPLAFLLARKATGYERASYKKADSRNDLLSRPNFIEAFASAKTRIRAMEIRFVEEADQIRQTLLEVYVAVLLETPYNDFKTH